MKRVQRRLLCPSVTDMEDDGVEDRRQQRVRLLLDDKGKRRDIGCDGFKQLRLLERDHTRKRLCKQRNDTRVTCRLGTDLATQRLQYKQRHLLIRPVLTDYHNQSAHLFDNSCDITGVRDWKFTLRKPLLLGGHDVLGCLQVKSGPK